MSDHKPATLPVKKTDKAKSVKLTPEQKAIKFKKLATARVNRAVKVIGHIGNLSGSNYVRTDAQVEKIFAVLREAVNQAEIRFAAKQKSESVGIQL